MHVIKPADWLNVLYLSSITLNKWSLPDRRAQRLTSPKLSLLSASKMCPVNEFRFTSTTVHYRHLWKMTSHPNRRKGSLYSVFPVMLEDSHSSLLFYTFDVMLANHSARKFKSDPLHRASLKTHTWPVWHQPSSFSMLWVAEKVSLIRPLKPHRLGIFSVVWSRLSVHSKLLFFQVLVQSNF